MIIIFAIRVLLGHWIAVALFISIFQLIIINEVSGFRVFWVVFARG